MHYFSKKTFTKPTPCTVRTSVRLLSFKFRFKVVFCVQFRVFNFFQVFLAYQFIGIGLWEAYAWNVEPRIFMLSLSSKLSSV